jgi:hypothetical protein
MHQEKVVHPVNEYRETVRIWSWLMGRLNQSFLRFPPGRRPYGPEAELLGLVISDSYGRVMPPPSLFPSPSARGQGVPHPITT